MAKAAPGCGPPFLRGPDCDYNTRMRTGFTWVQVLVLILAAGLGLVILGGGGWLAWNTALAPAAAPQTTPVLAQPTSAATPTLFETLAPPQAELTEAPAGLATETTAPFDPLACLAGVAPARDAQIQDALEGGLLVVELDGKRSEVSLIGVDPVGPSAENLALLRELALGKTARLYSEGSELDGQGRLRRYVLIGKTFVNYELVLRGAALPAFYPPGAGCLETLLAAERLARGVGLGYWALQAGLPTSPAVQGTSASPACDCGKTYACTDFKTRSAAQACYNACGDYRNTTLDPDHNGEACEDLP